MLSIIGSTVKRRTCFEAFRFFIFVIVLKVVYLPSNTRQRQCSRSTDFSWKSDGVVLGMRQTPHPKAVSAKSYLGTLQPPPHDDPSHERHRGSRIWESSRPKDSTESAEYIVEKWAPTPPVFSFVPRLRKHFQRTLRSCISLFRVIKRDVTKLKANSVRRCVSF